MTHVIFENDGEIDPVAIKTFGVSVKEGERPIGFFGTGIKYAAAIIMRLGGKIAVQSGERVLVFGSRRAVVRGKEFDIMTLGGEDLGFTTEVGKTWAPWMAYRELRCNAADEGGVVRTSAEWPAPIAGKTRIVVKCDEIVLAHESAGAYFIEGQPIASGTLVEVHAAPNGGTTSWYYRGVKVGEHRKPALFAYNVTMGVDLTEDRTAKNPWTIGAFLAHDLINSKCREVLLPALIASDQTFEGDLDFDGQAREPSKEFIAVIEELLTDRLAKINFSALTLYKRKTLKNLDPTSMAMTAAEAKMLDRAVALLERHGFTVRDYPILLTESLGKSYLAVAEGGRIYVTHRVFEMGTKKLAAALLEEWVHLKHDMHDLTRDLQTWLFDKVVSLLEDMEGEPL